MLSACMRAMPTQIRRIAVWWNILYTKIGGGGYSPDPELDSTWPTAMQPPVKLRSGYLTQLNLRDWLERRAYFSGHYYQHDIELLLQRLLRPGDIWIDVGANIGLVSLIAAGRIGARGRGYAFEPNPDVYRRLVGHMSLNKISYLSCKNVALGSEPGVAKLSRPVHSGQGSLVHSDDAGGDRIDVPVVRGDDVLSVSNKDIALVKIDVEGYELEVLKGMTRILRHKDTAVIVEVLHTLLRKSGTTARELLDFMIDLDFRPYEFMARSFRFGKSLEVSSLAAIRDNYEGDVLFLKSDSEFARRLNV